MGCVIVLADERRRKEVFSEYREEGAHVDVLRDSMSLYDIGQMLRRNVDILAIRSEMPQSRIAEFERSGIRIKFEEPELTKSIFSIGMADFQNRVGKWVRTCFGRQSLRSPKERAQRMLEEAVELAQAVGLSQEDADRVLKDVYARPAGEIGQEVGGVANTLAALCAGLDHDLETEAWREMLRVEKPEVIEKCRRKQAEKAARGVSEPGIDHAPHS